MASIDRPGFRPGGLQLSEVPPAPRPTAESGTRRVEGRSYFPPPELDLHPTPAELHTMDAVLEALAPMTSDSMRTRWHEALRGGAYTSVLEELAATCLDAPRNRTLRLLHERLREVVRDVMRARLGPSTRKLLACEHEGRLTPGMRRIVDAAREPITIADLVRSTGGDELAAGERILRLMQHGWLLAARTPSAPPGSSRRAG